MVHVSDGDTIVAELQGQKERISLLGVDAPAKPQRRWGQRAKVFTPVLVFA